MLGRLIKYEFRATGRIMLPLYGSLLIMAILCRLSMSFISEQKSILSSFTNGIFITVYVLLIFAVGFMSIILMAQRFYQNLLGDEGYLMFTLPVSISGNIISKLIVSIVWFFASALADFISMAIVTFRVEHINQIINSFRDVFSKLTPYYTLHGFLFLAEGVLFMVIGMASAVLVVYASIAVGHYFNSHRILIAFAAFIGFMIASQIVGMIGIMILQQFNWHFITSILNRISGLHFIIITITVISALYGAVFYFITHQTLNKHLNLE